MRARHPRWRPAAALTALVLVMGGCTTAAPVPTLHWQQAYLPGAPNGQVHALAECDGHWYAVGSTQTGDAPAPAAWTSLDAQRWTAMTMHPVSVYGPSHVFSSVACRGSTVVTVGSAPGGAHGNLRTNTWLAQSSATLTEVPAPFEQYGGPNQIGVGKLAAGANGFVMVGARVDANGQPGIAVWHSTDGSAFQLIDSDPALESTGLGGASAASNPADPSQPAAGQVEVDGVTITADGGFETVGAILPNGAVPLALHPAAWSSPDGVTWRRQDVTDHTPGTAMQLVVPFHGGLLAVGYQGTTWNSWLRGSTSWTQGGRFGKYDDVGAVTGLVTVGGRAYVAIGGPDELWTTTDGHSWQQLPTPHGVASGRSTTVLALQTDGTSLLLSLFSGGPGALLWRAVPG